MKELRYCVIDREWDIAVFESNIFKELVDLINSKFRHPKYYIYDRLEDKNYYYDTLWRGR